MGVQGASAPARPLPHADPIRCRSIPALESKKQVETVGGGPGLCSARTITRIRMAASPTSMRTTILRIRTRTTGLASPTEVRKRKGRTDGKESCGNSMGRRGRPQQSRIPSSLTTPSAIVKEVENHVRVAKAVSRLHSHQGGKVNENGRPQKMKAATKREKRDATHRRFRAKAGSMRSIKADCNQEQKCQRRINIS